MSRDDSEFAAYLAARWPSLVRTLVLLDVPERTAHRVAEDALARIHPDFPRLSREEDVDVAVYRELFDARDRQAKRDPDVPARRRRWPRWPTRTRRTTYRSGWWSLGRGSSSCGPRSTR